MTLEDGGAPLDLLRGDAIDYRGASRRHRVEFTGGIFKRGLGGRVAFDWQSATEASGLGAASDPLRWSPLARFNLGLFANLQERFAANTAPAWAKNTRLSLNVSNLFNARPTVRDAAGQTPLLFRPTYLDPIGRSVTLELRKTF